jgi:hypothetical protein
LENASGVVPVAVIVILVVEVFVIVLVPIVIVLVPVVLFLFFFLFLFFLGGVAGPAFRLLGLLEVELMPGIEIDLLDIAVLVLDLDQLLVGVDRQHFEDLVLFEILVPFSLDRVVISGHAKHLKRRRTGVLTGRRNIRGILQDCQAVKQQ